jgi:thiol-disulfide isomerase/thioredoxin
MTNRTIAVLGPMAACVSVFHADSQAGQNAVVSQTIGEKYPGLASSVLTFAYEADLPDGVLLKSGSIEITTKELEQDLGKAPENMREQLKKNAFFQLEQLSAKKLLLAAARKDAAKSGMDFIGKSEDDIMKGYLATAAEKVQVTDSEVAAFYEANKDMCGGASLSQVKNDLKQYVLQEKQQAAVTEYVRTIGKRMAITVSSKWAVEQAKMAKDNPVDKARGSGIPSLVDFGSTGCKPCDMMTPVLANLKQKYSGKLNVLFIHVGQEQVLGARYGIQSIPVQALFDKDGKEVFRHTGFWAQSEIEKKLETVGVK